MPHPAEWLLVVNVSVDESVEERWNRWYDEEHLPEIVDCPGFLNGTRYLCREDGKRSYLTIYELAGPDALESEAFRNRRGWRQFQDRVDARVRLFQLSNRLEDTSARS